LISCKITNRHTFSNGKLARTPKVWALSQN
jgi:hypothetical protein